MFARALRLPVHTRRILSNMACRPDRDGYESVPEHARGDESLMSKKAHGSTEQPVQAALRYGCDHKTATQICCFNRHYAEHSGYFLGGARTWLTEVKDRGEVEYFDSVTGKLLFTAPRGRTFAQFLQESDDHGWPSFRDEETNWENVRVLRDGEAVSVDGTHLGHNLPDRKGNRFCINLVSIAGSPAPKL